MSEIYDMVDEMAQTEEDIFSGKFCKCGHLLSIHCAGKCYSFNFDGAKFWSCTCTTPIMAKFEIKVKIHDSLLLQL